MKDKDKIFTSSILGALSGFLGLAGVLGWCCTIAGAAILSFLGLSSLVAFLTYHNKWFFAAAIVFTILAIYFYVKYKKSKSCLVKK